MRFFPLYGSYGHLWALWWAIYGWLHKLILRNDFIRNMVKIAAYSRLWTKKKKKKRGVNIGAWPYRLQASEDTGALNTMQVWRQDVDPPPGPWALTPPFFRWLKRVFSVYLSGIRSCKNKGECAAHISAYFAHILDFWYHACFHIFAHIFQFFGGRLIKKNRVWMNIFGPQNFFGPPQKFEFFEIIKKVPWVYLKWSALLSDQKYHHILWQKCMGDEVWGSWSDPIF